MEEDGTPVADVKRSMGSGVYVQDYTREGEISITSPPGRGRYMRILDDDEMIEVGRFHWLSAVVMSSESAANHSP